MTTMMMMPPRTTDAEVDLDLLNGFRFSCRRDCALCCYTTPMASRVEAARLLEIEPNAPVIPMAGGGGVIQARPGGGACHFLDGTRCRVHAARPFPCREFPIIAHAGPRLQATLVLSCPGVSLDPLTGWGSPSTRRRAPSGLHAELDSMVERIQEQGGSLRRQASAVRRRFLRRLGRERLEDFEEALRGDLEHDLPAPRRQPAPGPPSSTDGLERLPLIYDGLSGPVALTGDGHRWWRLELRPGGGIGAREDLGYPPEELPPLESAAEECLEGYLRYWLRRDALFGIVVRARRPRSLEQAREAVRDELANLATEVVTRAEMLRGPERFPGSPLDVPALDRGIRAVDMDFLDRPSWAPWL